MRCKNCCCASSNAGAEPGGAVSPKFGPPTSQRRAGGSPQQQITAAIHAKSNRDVQTGLWGRRSLVFKTQPYNSPLSLKVSVPVHFGGTQTFRRDLLVRRSEHNTQAWAPSAGMWGFCWGRGSRTCRKLSTVRRTTSELPD